MRYGWTLLELIISIGVLSIAGLMVIGPMAISSGAIGNNGPIIQTQKILLIKELWAQISADLASIDNEDWPLRLQSISAQSPSTTTQSIDGKQFHITQNIMCVTKELKTENPSCDEGFALIIMTVVTDDYPLSATFIKTRAGL